MLLTHTSILLSLGLIGATLNTNGNMLLAQTAPEIEPSKQEVVQKKPSIAQTLAELRAMGHPKKEVVTVGDIVETVKEVIRVPQTVTRIACKGCNENEIKTLNFLQDRGINDRHALATVMGNIKQESMFVSNICEGGARVAYHNCHSGGYGLIQWTSINRYRGLGNFANRYGGNPSTIETQLRYMVTEPQWIRIEPSLKAGGNSVNGYMRHAYGWLGWGVHGARTHYSNGYLNRFYTATETIDPKESVEVETPKVIQTFAEVKK